MKWVSDLSKDHLSERAISFLEATGEIILLGCLVSLIIIISIGIEKLLKALKLINQEANNKVKIELKWGFFYSLIMEGLVDIG